MTGDIEVTDGRLRACMDSAETCVSSYIVGMILQVS